MADAIDNFRSVVAGCAVWQDLVGASGTAEEKAADGAAAIWRFGEEPRPDPPAMFLRFAEVGRSRVSSTGFQCRGTIEFHVLLPRPEGADTLDEEHQDRMGEMRDLMDEVCSRSLSTGLIDLADIQISEMRRSGRRDEEKYWSFKGEARFPAL